MVGVCVKSTMIIYQEHESVPFLWTQPLVTRLVYRIIECALHDLPCVVLQPPQHGSLHGSASTQPRSQCKQRHIPYTLLTNPKPTRMECRTRPCGGHLPKHTSSLRYLTPTVHTHVHVTVTSSQLRPLAIVPLNPGFPSSCLPPTLLTQICTHRQQNAWPATVSPSTACPSGSPYPYPAPYLCPAPCLCLCPAPDPAVPACQVTAIGTAPVPAARPAPDHALSLAPRPPACGAPPVRPRPTMSGRVRRRADGGHPDGGRRCGRHRRPRHRSRSPRPRHLAGGRDRAGGGGMVIMVIRARQGQ